MKELDEFYVKDDRVGVVEAEVHADKEIATIAEKEFQGNSN